VTGALNRIARYSPRVKVALLIPVVVALGFACKAYPGPGRDWINHWGPASVAYVWFFMLAVFFIVPQPRLAMPIAGCVVLATCLVEFSQWGNPEILKPIRQTIWGKFLLGTTFRWWDFPAYLFGGLTGISLLVWCGGRAAES